MLFSLRGPGHKQQSRCPNTQEHNQPISWPNPQWPASDKRPTTAKWLFTPSAQTRVVTPRSLLLSTSANPGLHRGVTHRARPPRSKQTFTRVLQGIFLLSCQNNMKKSHRTEGTHLASVQPRTPPQCACTHMGKHRASTGGHLVVAAAGSAFTQRLERETDGHT